MKKLPILFFVLVIILLVISIVSFNKKQEQVFCTADAKLCPDGSAVGRIAPNCEFAECPKTETITYTNNQYGFNFNLPKSWLGYSIIEENWEGNFIDTENNQKITGPKILIRHPLWTKETPRQDIPIMIFTLDQWNLIQQEKISVSAAPIGPSELGRNSKYVFALPARYNYAFPVGFEEVDIIIQNKPLQAF